MDRLADFCIGHCERKNWLSKFPQILADPSKMWRLEIIYSHNYFLELCQIKEQHHPGGGRGEEEKTFNVIPTLPQQATESLGGKKKSKTYFSK